MSRVQLLLKIYETLKSDNQAWHPLWNDVAKIFIPSRDDIYSSNNPGQEKRSQLYDSSPAHANVLLASAFHSILTNAALKWFALTTGDAKLDATDAVKSWLQEATNVVHDILNGSNFQTEIHKTYMDLGTLGTAPLFMEEDPIYDIRFKALPVFQTFLDENNNNEIDTVLREYKWTMRQIVQEFGPDKLPEELVKNKLTSTEKYTMIHAILPRTEELTDKRANKKSLKAARFGSYHIFLKTKTMLRESGFRELRYAVPRWSVVSGEKMGRSPAMESLPDARMLQVMMKTIIRGAQKVVDPPVQIVDDGQYRPLRFTPGGVNYVRPGSDGIKPIMTGARVDIGKDVLEDVRNRIRQAFYADQLQLVRGPQMTAEESRIRSDQDLRLLGPILGRTHNELLKPVIDTTFVIADRRGKIPPMPAILKERAGKELKITYLSAIARAQKTSESTNLLLALQDVGPIIQSDPSAMDVIDAEEALRDALDKRGVSHRVIRKTADIKTVRDARAEATQKEIQSEETAQTAQNVGNMAKAM